MSGPTPFNSTFGALPTTIFELMSQLAMQHGSINLGQGFPDKELEGPASMKEAAYRFTIDGSNQYPPMAGLPEVRQALAAHSERYTGLALDWKTQVLITSGATEALAAAFFGLLEPGDEVILFAPLYDSYVPIVERAGAKAVVLPLQAPDWHFDREEVAAAFSSKTKLIVVNTPHNPTGKVFTEEELAFLAELVVKHDAYALLDEVYEHLVFPGFKHVTMRALPGMEDRCLRIGSAGKTFSFTAWKVGWVTGPPAAVAAAAKAHQFLTFTVPSAYQHAVAVGLEQERAFYEGLGPLLEKKRDWLAKELTEIGFKILPGQGTYFLVADFSGLLPEGSDEDDVSFCSRLTVDGGVTLIPVSASKAPRNLVRFVICKTDEKLEAAVQKLRAYLAA
ncbi:hypothetical protein QBZ16_001767 [Prototheca wickerhamii]|uniref:Aminotransferase class I/classII large domain-containing protein n=1 Tax=Prototheca wickerhamii TaxID=3111 RepID=A0AAD9MFX2_PROWI|nr:hypothetical protein QBZ16_001767 [Prototheca wickerhamii]